MTPKTHDKPGKPRTVPKLLTLVGVMLVLSFASVPLYAWFRGATGYGGTTQSAAAAPDRILEQTVKVRFDGSLTEGMPWQIRPVQRTMDLRIGEVGLAFFEAHNPTDRPIAGNTTFNVFPFSAGSYFNKMDCFCFEPQVLEPGETVQLPVTFFVDPEMLEDPATKYVTAITLSYTFYETDLPEAYASLQAGPVNN